GEKGVHPPVVVKLDENLLVPYPARDGDAAHCRRSNTRRLTTPLSHRFKEASCFSDRPLIRSGCRVPVPAVGEGHTLIEMAGPSFPIGRGRGAYAFPTPRLGLAESRLLLHDPRADDVPRLSAV